MTNQQNNQKKPCAIKCIQKKYLPITWTESHRYKAVFLNFLSHLRMYSSTVNKRPNLGSLAFILVAEAHLFTRNRLYGRIQLTTGGFLIKRRTSSKSDLYSFGSFSQYCPMRRVGGHL